MGSIVTSNNDVTVFIILILFGILAFIIMLGVCNKFRNGGSDFDERDNRYSGDRQRQQRSDPAANVRKRQQIESQLIVRRYRAKMRKKSSKQLVVPASETDPSSLEQGRNTQAASNAPSTETTSAERKQPPEEINTSDDSSPWSLNRWLPEQEKPKQSAKYSKANKTTAMRQSSSVSSVVSHTTTEQCDICLMEYQEGDWVCFSANTCSHAFHKKCMIDWLIRNKNCPCCRKPFIGKDDEVVGGEGEA